MFFAALKTPLMPVLAAHNPMEIEKLDTLAEQVLKAFYTLDSQLHLKGKRSFPHKELDCLLAAVEQYANAVGDGNLIHRNVAKEIAGFREYLMLDLFNTPGEALYIADRMECILFSGYDSFFEGDEPPGL